MRSFRDTGDITVHVDIGERLQMKMGVTSQCTARFAPVVVEWGHRLRTPSGVRDMYLHSGHARDRCWVRLHRQEG